MSQIKDNFVTVVEVGSNQQDISNDSLNIESNSLGYVTVLTIGNTENNSKVLKDVTEEVIVYRLPGERLGFGLKFEGGTKASEFVKRLFIQSCAADSPASRVKSSWGKLTEGDEVLEIDSIPVITMTRIDCVRCLKDSNVAIKLLVHHIFDTCKSKTKSEDEPPLIISTEEKRTPPPPPPVPPRKIPRKIFKNVNSNVPKEATNNSQDSSQKQQTSELPTTNGKAKKLQSPRSSGRSYYSPDVPRRDRRFSDGSLGPPDAEVYVDLFLQESTQSLSESDDTGSTISTIIDRFGSFPTTTTSSFSGSLPSTPTSVQKHLDLSNITIYDDEDIVTTNKSTVKSIVQSKEENNNTITSIEESPLCFQDAPLSYGNESTKMITPDETDSYEKEVLHNEENKSSVKKPPVPPRSKDSNQNTNVDVAKDTKRNENADLPRLVDFVPKSSNGLKDNIENSTEIMKLFLENERYKTNFIDYDTDENENLDTYSNGIDLYSSKWSLSSQLATIGEVEEEAGSEINYNKPSVKSTPVVIVENADFNNESKKSQCQNGLVNNIESNGIMEPIYPSDSRQPPDGHEFPDFIEDNEPVKQSSAHIFFQNNEKEEPAITFSSEIYTTINTKVSLLDAPGKTKPSNLILCQSVSTSNTDLRKNIYDSTEDLKYADLISEPTNLHTRSQSLIDMSTLSKQKNSKWNLMVEQRRKGLSKLKGLVIPEASENEVLPSINIPEIKSQNTTTFVPVPKLQNSNSTQMYSNHNDSSKSPIIIPHWSANTTATNLPKYSPAFKRRSLQVYPTSSNKNENSEYISNSDLSKYCDKLNSRINKLGDDDINSPKSLESIASPTRSDCSFDYVSSKKCIKDSTDSFQKSHINKVEDESDNDSAVSSSQSSYNSRFSPPPSPTRSCELNHFKKLEDDDKLNSQNRLLKPSSVEAINRKNILASAKCRSGKDLKIGSPVIRRKQEEEQKQEKQENKFNTETIIKEELSNNQQDTTGILDKVNNAFANVESISKEIAKPPAKILEVEKSIDVPKTPLKSAFMPIKPLIPIPPNNNSTNTKDNKITKDIYSSSSVLSRRAKPINVKALKENFENFGSSPPPLPQKVPIYKPQITTRSVKAEIAKTENKIINNEIRQKKNEKTEVNLNDIKPRKSSLVKEEEVEVIKKIDSEIISLNLESLGGSLGITLAGGTDYENKEITVHRIRYGSVAYHDGRLKRGDKIISVNGKNTAGLTHAEAVELLKEPVTEFSIEIEDGKEAVSSTTSTLQRRSSSLSLISEFKGPSAEPPKKPTKVISFLKDGAGLGFSIEGGKDSPQGDVPLVVKKIFTGGAADKCGELKVGDELLYINDINFANLSRIEAWSLMKKLPDEIVNIHIFR